MFRLILSTIIGFMIGRERKKHKKTAGGGRTMAIVSLGACMIALLTDEIFQISGMTFNYTRLMAGGIGGISFIGAGIIWKHKNDIEGLTTASTLFSLIPINYFIGLGYYYHGILSAVLVFIILESKYWKK